MTHTLLDILASLPHDDRIETLKTDLVNLRVRLHDDVQESKGSKPRNIAIGRLALYDDIVAGTLCTPIVKPPRKLTKAQQRMADTAAAVAAKPEPEPEPDPWYVTHLHRLGVDSDADIARDVGVSRSRVHQVRQRLGIANAPRRGMRAASIPDLEQIRDRLGTVSDYVLAAEVKRTPKWVSSTRSRLGIPPFTESKNQPSSLASIAEYHSLVGTMSDAKLAEMASVQKYSVYYYRLVHNIPSFRSTRQRSKS